MYTELLQANKAKVKRKFVVSQWDESPFLYTLMISLIWSPVLEARISISASSSVPAPWDADTRG